MQIVQDEVDALHGKEREEKSDAHEAADLIAQVRAASAAERAAIASESQAASAIWSAIAVVISLAIAAWAALSAGASSRAAASTLQTMQNTAERQLRAYVGIMTLTARTAEVVVRLRNNGQTPGTNLCTWAGHSNTAQSAEQIRALEVQHPASAYTTAWMGTDFYIHIPVPNLDGALQSGLFVFGFVKYEDAFQHQRVTMFQCEGCFVPPGWRFESFKVGNEAT